MFRFATHASPPVTVDTTLLKDKPHAHLPASIKDCLMLLQLFMFNESLVSLESLSIVKLQHDSIQRNNRKTVTNEVDIKLIFMLCI